MTRLLKITDLGSGIMVQGTDNVLYPDNATLTYPYNSIIVITDESNIATFRSASNNDVLFSGLIGKIEIGGEIVTKENINTKFDAIANKPSIPDTSEFITKEEYNPKELATAKALTQLNETKADKTEIPDVSTFATKTELNAKANSADLATVATSGSYNDLTNKPSIPDTSEFITKEEYNPKELATAKALTQLNETKADKTELPDVSTFVTKTELNAKQDTLVSGTNIKTINNQSILGEGNIEIQGGASEQQQAYWNQTETTSVDYIKNKPTNVSAFANDAGYLTQHQSLADYYTKSEIDAMVGNINTILASI